LGIHCGLGCGGEFAAGHSFVSQALHGVHYIGLLRQKCVPQRGGPLYVPAQQLEHIRENHQGLHTRIPVLLLRGAHQGIASQLAILLKPLVGLDDLQRIGHSHQHLAEQRIRVKGDWRDQAFQLRGRQTLAWFLLWLGGLLAGRRQRLLGEERRLAGYQEQAAEDRQHLVEPDAESFIRHTHVSSDAQLARNTGATVNEHTVLSTPGQAARPSASYRARRGSGSAPRFLELRRSNAIPLHSRSPRPVRGTCARPAM
jgi:hypothetical protein